MDTENSLSARFFADAKRISLGESQNFRIAAPDLLQIASDVALRAILLRLFRTQIRDDHTAEIIFAYIEYVIDGEEEMAERLETYAVGLERYAGRLGYGATAAGIGALLTGATPVSAFILVSGGLTAMVASGVGSTILKSKVRARRLDAKRLTRLLDALRQTEDTERPHDRR